MATSNAELSSRSCDTGYSDAASSEIGLQDRIHEVGRGANIGLLSLPPEIRYDIYEYLLSARLHAHRDSDGLNHYPLHTSILRANKLIHREATKVLYSKNTFISIETPWRQAEDHVHHEGKVNIIAQGDRAQTFPTQFTVTISMPELANKIAENFVILADELPNFCRIWYYSDLTHLSLNSNLALHITLNQSFYLKSTSQSQSSILAPFGLIKGLHSFGTSNLDPTTESRLLTEMAIPYATPEACIATSEKSMTEGEAAMRAGQYRAALEHFVRAFHAIHIVVQGRDRRIWADAYFEKEMSGGDHNGEHGGIVRMILRLKLVSGVVDAYVALGEYSEAAYWGRRSINLMREALGQRAEAPGPGFPASSAWGRILLKTGVACAELGERAEAKILFDTARRWLQGVEEEEVRIAMENMPSTDGT